MSNKIFEQEYDISLFFVNSQKNLGLYQLLNILQDVALRHAASTDYSGQQQEKVYWVITRQSLKAQFWAKLGDKIVVKTWLTTNKRRFLVREYAVFLGKEKICTCSTSVAKLDAVAKKIISIDENDLQKYTKTQELPYIPNKVPTFADYDVLKTFSVRNSDIDFNQHVNNTVYCKWILDSIPYEDHFKYNLLSYNVNFLAESHLGDEIEIQAQAKENSFIFQGLRLLDQKFVFTAEIDIEAKGC